MILVLAVVSTLFIMLLALITEGKDEDYGEGI